MKMHSSYEKSPLGRILRKTHFLNIPRFLGQASKFILLCAFLCPVIDKKSFLLLSF